MSLGDVLLDRGSGDRGCHALRFRADFVRFARSLREYGQVVLGATMTRVLAVKRPAF